MILRSRVRDCLFLNWALPAEQLPEPPAALRYQRHSHAGEDWVFASALLFRQDGVHVPSAPWARLSYPQMNLRFYTLDADDVPSVWFHRMWVPPWVSPLARWIGRQTAHTAALAFPTAVDGETEEMSWKARASGELVVRATPGSVDLGVGPSLGSWDATVRYFRQRPRGYGHGPSGLRRVETSHVSTSVTPMRARLESVALLEGSLRLRCRWPELHSAWLCPQLTFDFELLPEKEKVLRRQLPAPG